ncbi:hypothetical protein DXG01_013823 [Tephrocybe rancida]|nr:hypothetical protein DXG01_013823 [Tephrocybe rancida]
MCARPPSANAQHSIQISIHTSKSGATTSFSTSSETSGSSLLKVKRPTTALVPPRTSKATLTPKKPSLKVKKQKECEARATTSPCASLPERQRRVSFLPPGTNPGQKSPNELHPLLSFSQIRRITRLLDLPSPSPPLSLAYDVSSPPSPCSITIIRTLEKDSAISRAPSKIPLDHEMIISTLVEPATVPPTTSQLVLTSLKFPWEIMATSVCKSSASSANASSTPNAMAKHTTNLDVLHAIHLSLAARVTAKEWEILSSSGKKRVLKAYEKRCVKADGGWDEGVRRVDYLCGKTMLVGIEFTKDKFDDQKPFKGKLVFTLPPSTMSA